MFQTQLFTYIFFFSGETNARANTVQIPIFFVSSSFETQCLIPQLVLYINTHSPPLIYQRWITPINAVCATKLFSVEDEWNMLDYEY